MRVLAAALAVLLLAAVCSPAQADLRVSTNAGSPKIGNTSTSCCSSFISRPIPHSMIRFAYRTSSNCALQAVIVVTWKGKKVCADPEALWVKEYLKNLQLQVVRNY